MGTMCNLENDLAKELIYEFTQDEEFLFQYARLVDQYYKKDLDLDLVENKMNAGLVELLNDEYVFIVRDDRRVIAGTKLSFSCNSSNVRLPMEEGKFTVCEYLPTDYGNQSYAEIGRLVVDPTYRGKDVLQNMIVELTKFSIKHGCGFLFVLAPALNSVLYRRICRSLKMPIKLHKEAWLPDKSLYRRLDIKLLSCDIRNLPPFSFPEAQMEMAAVNGENNISERSMPFAQA